MHERIDDDNSKLSTADLVKRIDDWMERLGQLRQLVDGWISERPDNELSTASAPAVPMREYLMQQCQIPERSMPAFRVMKGGKQLALFRPVGLWVIGANGRVDVFTEKAAPILVDSAQHFEKPAWKLYMSKSPRDAIEFNKESFYSILGLA
jgi:hypothetical protein